MRRVLFSAVAVALGLSGCRATPGFTVKLELVKPPVLQSPSPMSPVQAPPVSYAVEQVQPWPSYIRAPFEGRARTPLSVSAPDPCPPEKQTFEKIPAPRTNEASTPAPRRMPNSDLE